MADIIDPAGGIVEPGELVFLLAIDPQVQGAIPRPTAGGRHPGQFNGMGFVGDRNPCPLKILLCIVCCDYLDIIIAMHFTQAQREGDLPIYIAPFE